MSERHAERRVVTALFVDVVGSTALTRVLGPERIKRALDRAFAELAALIDAEGGTVEKFAGDAVHAIFGAPVAHPDDRLRALRAAQACARWGAGPRSDARTLAVRIGVETGEAIVDLAAVEGRREQMSVGTCVNLAARLQQLAEPGQVLVGPVCHEAAAESAEFEALGTVELKGLGRLPAWRLVSVAAPRAGARVPFVGRDAELELLRLAFRRARAGRSVLVLVSGSPGQGKSRLVDEFVTGLGAEARVLRARCRPAGSRHCSARGRPSPAVRETRPRWLDSSRSTPIGPTIPPSWSRRYAYPRRRGTPPPSGRSSATRPFSRIGSASSPWRAESTNDSTRWRPRGV